MKLGSILKEMVVKEAPSSEVGVSYPLNKEFTEMKDSIKNYAKKTAEQFKQTLSSKVKGKMISLSSSEEAEPFLVSDIIIGNSIVFVTNDGKKVTYTEGDITIHNDQEAPVTSAIQSTSQPTDTPNKVKQF